MTLDRRAFLRLSAVAGGVVLLGRGLVATARPLGRVDDFGTSRLSRLFPGERLVHSDLHNHSHFSDAAGDPDRFYERIRSAGIDVAALTDHSTVSKPGSQANANFDQSICGPEPEDGSESGCHSLIGLDEEDWNRCRVLADAANEDDRFIGLRGFEWSSPTVGHSNVWFSDNWIDPLATGGLDGDSTLAAIADGSPGPFGAAGATVEALVTQFEREAGRDGVEGYYNWLNRNPSDPQFGGGSDGIFGFNHPGREAGRFASFRLERSLLPRLVSMELFNKGEDYLFEGVNEGRPSPLVDCLDAGWKPGILGTSDEHDPNWGAALAKGKSGLWAKELSRRGVREALEARRFFATREKGLRVDAAANGQRMGSTFGHQAGVITFELDIAQSASPLALRNGDESTPPIGVPGTRLVLQVLQTGRPVPTVRHQQDVTVPAPDQPVITVAVPIDTDDGRWVVVRLCDPLREHDIPDGAAEQMAMADRERYIAAGRGVVYTSPWYLRPDLAPPLVLRAPGNPSAPPPTPMPSETATAGSGSGDGGSGSGDGGSGSGDGGSDGSGPGTASPSPTPSASPSPTPSPTQSRSPGSPPSATPTPSGGPSGGAQPTVPVRVSRIAGATRIETAVEVSQAGFAAGTPFAYVATSGDFADALAGVPAAALEQAPILLADRDGLPEVTAQELARLAPMRITVLGGPAAVSAGVEAALGEIAPTERLGGADRLETAVRISAARFSPGVDDVGIATAGAFPDALAGGPALARVPGPLLLVGSDALPEVVEQELRRLAPRVITVLGGTSAVSDAVLAALGPLARESARRQSGGDRFATAAAIAQARFARAADVFVTTGSDFPDALTAGPLAAQRQSPVLLVTSTEVPAPTDEQLRRLRPERITIVGGTGVVSAALEQALRRYESG